MSSLKERATARRRALEKEKTFVLPLPGYEDMFAVRYRPLVFEQVWELQQRNGGLGQSAEGDIGYFADLIINGCVEFLEVQGKDEQGQPQYAVLGQKWTAQMANELFDAGLAEDASAREAVFAVFTGPNGSALLALHAHAYDTESDRALTAIDEEASGNSEARSAPAAPSTSQ